MPSGVREKDYDEQGESQEVGQQVKHVWPESLKKNGNLSGESNLAENRARTVK